MPSSIVSVRSTLRSVLSGAGGAGRRTRSTWSTSRSTRSKTKIMIVSPTFGKFFFDAVFATEHQSTVTVTTHPVQSGASVADHAYVEPDTVMLDIGMSDVMSSGTNHSVNAYATLRAIMEQREPVKLRTRLKTYSNMVITSLAAPDDHTTMYALRATVMFTNVRIVKVSVVDIQQTVSGSGSHNYGGSTGSTGGRTGGRTGGSTGGGTRGTQQTTGRLRSALSQLFGR